MEIRNELGFNREEDFLMNRLQKKYFEIKTALGVRPTRAEMYLRLGKKFDRYLRRGWLSFLSGIGELAPEEMRFVGTAVEDFLIELEETKLDKAYKIPAVLAFVTGNGVRSTAHLTDIARSLSDFYHLSQDHQRDLRNRGNRNWLHWDINDFAHLARKKPVKELSKSRFFHYHKIRHLVQLDRSLSGYLNLTLAAQIQDIMEYRRLEFFRDRYRVDPKVIAEVAATKIEEESGVKIHKKLVRDRIPELIEAQGKKCEFRTLDQAEFLLELNWKLEEELAEYMESGTVEELADLFEVIQTILRVKGISKKKLEEIMAEKREERGGFEKKLFLIKVE